MPQFLATSDPGFDEAFRALLAQKREDSPDVDATVAAIIADVRARGDAALLDTTARFDRLHLTADRLRISEEEIDALIAQVPQDQREALELAAARIRAYHARQMPRDESWTDDLGATLGWRWTPVSAAGLYVPGGLASYPSSVLMNAIPAKVAGVQRLAVTVPTPDGIANPLVLLACRISGVDEVFRIGGAQAIAALAYGTASVRPVDKITGPGNAYVAAAKRRVFGKVGIDMIAGPSEILVLADGSTPADWVAMDLFSQAEHDELAQSILLCPDRDYIEAVQAQIDELLPSMPRAEIIAKSLNGRGALIRTRSMDEACAISNRIAPEHLEIASADPNRWEPLLKHAGAIFLGGFTSESLGDYCAGPNHVLPTSSTARFSSPLGVYDFQKRSSVIEVSEEGAQVLGRIASTLAHGEGLQAHARAAEMWLKP